MDSSGLAWRMGIVELMDLDLLKFSSTQITIPSKLDDAHIALFGRRDLWRLKMVLVWLLLSCIVVKAGSAHFDPYAGLRRSAKVPAQQVPERLSEFSLGHSPGRYLNTGHTGKQIFMERSKAIGLGFRSVGSRKLEWRVVESVMRAVRPCWPNATAQVQSSLAFLEDVSTSHTRTTGMDWKGAWERRDRKKGWKERVESWHQPPAELQGKFVAELHIPLEILFAGAKELGFTVRVSLWGRAMATVRGGFGGWLFSSAILHTVVFAAHETLVFQKQKVLFTPFFRRGNRLLRMFWPSSVRESSAYASGYGVGPCISMWNKTLPTGPSGYLFVDVRPGTKAGDQLSYKFDGNEIVLRVKEARHPLYRRVGNDLHASVNLPRSRAKEGCTVELERLDGAERKISVWIPPRASVVVVPNEGWPIDRGQRGNLVVRVRVCR